MKKPALTIIAIVGLIVVAYFAVGFFFPKTDESSSSLQDLASSPTPLITVVPTKIHTTNTPVAKITTNTIAINQTATMTQVVTAVPGGVTIQKTTVATTQITTPPKCVANSIYMINVDSAEQTRLTCNIDSANSPVWSPDGSKITFGGIATDHINTHSFSAPEIFIMKADGSELKRLTYSNKDNFNTEGRGFSTIATFSPVWSPDGSKIAYSQQHHGASDTKICIMKDDGTNQICFNNIGQSTFDPTWSPDGSKIAFETSPGGGGWSPKIGVINSDGTGMTVFPNLGHEPSWSPDGTKIAFEFIPKYGTSELSIVNTDGTGLISLTNFSSLNPAWSPDGTKIAFASKKDGNSEIYLMNADGTGQVRLTHTQVNNGMPSWSPDGKKIAFISNYDGSRLGGISIINADGSGLITLPNIQRANIKPAWSPDGKKIVYAPL